MRGVLGTLLALLAGCGFRISASGGGSDAAPADSAADGPTDAQVTDAPPDAAPDAAHCVFEAWSTPVPLGELNTPAIEQAAWLTDDELTIYFTSNRSGGAGARDIWTATRSSLGQPFGTATPVGSLNTAADERHASLTPDGLVVVLASDRGGTLGSLDLWLASRATTADAFTTPVHLTTLSSPGLDFFPTISRDGSTLYFSSMRSGGAGGTDLYRATRLSPALPFAGLENLAVINSSGDDSGLALAADDLTLYVQTDRLDPEFDTWVTTRGATGDAFAAPTPIPGLDVAGGDYARWISLDGKRLYLSITPSGNAWDLFVASRDCE